MAIPAFRYLAWYLAGSASGSSLASAAVLGIASATAWLADPQLLQHPAEACMSNSASVLAELQALRVDLAALSARVLALESRLEEQHFTTPLASPVTVNLTQNSAASSLPELPPFPSPSVAATSPAGSGVSATPSPYRSSLEQTEEERRSIARDAGRFLARALQGDHRGTSGRERLKLQSRVYILAKDIGGQVYEPVKIFRSFAAIQPLVKHGFSCGESVFIGLPTIWEAKEAVRSAGLTWPDDA